MDAGRWKRIQEVFEQAGDLEGAERDAFLESACAGDPDLLGEVRSLLDASTDADEFIGGLAARAGLKLGETDGAEADPAGMRFGPYRVVRLLGRGGMGAVYVAERDDDHFRMEVALKAVPGTILTPEARGRFLSERQILARLHHPNIAQLLDGGVSNDGVPYFVMELVQGLRIDEYCRRKGLGIRERVDLFVQVCAGVQHAHGNLVVHRDLKPANILVTEEGTVKLLDFGIARMMESDEGLYETAVHAPHPMTLAYASPEQVLGEPPTTACDVYGLGVLLYRLLTDRHPYDFDSGTTFPKVQEVICRVAPAPPSTAAEHPDDARGISRDLDAVTLKALEKDPARRYASAAELAQDLERFMEGMPVTARPPTAGYRLRRFAGRHRAAVVFASVVTVMALALLGLGVRYTVDTREQADALAQEVQTTQAVSDFLVGLFTAANPSTGGSDTVSARTLLARGVGRVDEDLGDAPVLRARVLRTLSDVYWGLGLGLLSDSLGYEGLVARRDALGPAHPETLRDALTLADRNVIALNEPSFERAERLYREVLDLARGVPALRAQEIAAEKGMGELRRAQERPEEALPHLRTAAALARNAEDLGGGQRLSVQGTLARTFRDLSMHDSALATFREVLAGYEALGEAGERDAGSTRVSMAILLRREGRLEESAAEYREVLEKYRHTMGRGDVLTVQRNLAGVLRDQEKHDEMNAVLRESLAFAREHLPPDNWQVAQSYESLGQGLQLSGDLAEAEAMARRGLEVYETGLGPAHDWTARARGRLGEILAMLGRYDEAQSELDRALRDMLAARGPDNPMTREIQDRLDDLRRRRAGGAP